MNLFLLRVDESILEGYKSDSSKLVQFLQEAPIFELESAATLDKSWAGLMYLLTGSTIENPSGERLRILFSPNQIDKNQNLGYGPAYYLTAREVLEVNSDVQTIDSVELKKRFDPTKMEELAIYPIIWDEGEEAFEYLNHFWSQTQAFYKDAAAANQAVIQMLL